jgi:MoxR-like ATPase
MIPSAIDPSRLRAALAEVIVGQDAVLDGLLLALIADGHVLLEGPPGVAKTLACKTLAALIAASFQRVQFTPDLLPSDIVGTRIFDQREGAFVTVPGPIFANIVLADEINRAPAKVQSALLEAMQERQVTIGRERHVLPDPFLVMATMNPLEHEGTYALPLAQTDRFLMKIDVEYPTRVEEELAIVERFSADGIPLPPPLATLDDVRAWRRAAAEVHMEDSVLRYAVALVFATREGLPEELRPYVHRGASPRATLAVVRLARAHAVLAGRSFVIPDDVRSVAPAALRHRLAFTHRLAMENIPADTVVSRIVGSVTPP